MYYPVGTVACVKCCNRRDVSMSRPAAQLRSMADGGTTSLGCVCYDCFEEVLGAGIITGDPDVPGACRHWFVTTTPKLKGVSKKTVRFCVV